MSDKAEQTFLEVVKVWLPLGIAIAGALITWGMFTARQAAGETRLTNIENKQQRTDDTLSQLLQGQARLEAGVGYLTEKLK